MRIVGMIARLLLGLMFTVFGLNGFVHFMPMKAGAMSPLALQYMGAIAQSHMITFAFGVQLVTGLLLLAGVFVPLALVLLGPIVAQILLYHGTMDPKGIVPGLVAFALWSVVFLSVLPAFAGVFRMRPALPSRL